MIGFNWLKIEPGAEDGEIYVIGTILDDDTLAPLLSALLSRRP